MTTPPANPPALQGVRILSLSLNLPGPAALMRLERMGASCVKLEPPAPANAAAGITGDPMSAYSRTAYDALHRLWLMPLQYHGFDHPGHCGSDHYHSESMRI